MDVTLIYFSLSGNTRKVTEAMASALRESGHSVRTIPLKEATPQDAVKGDLLGVGTFCFASRAPTLIKDFLGDLPILDKRRAFVFATSGEAPGRVLYDQTRLLREKGADVIGGFLSRGEWHFAVPTAVGRYPGRPDKEDLAQAKNFAVAAAEHVHAGLAGPLPESITDALNRGWGFYDFLGLIATDAIARLMMPKPKLDREKCDQCEWCVSECPMGNITMEPYPEIGRNCIRCYHCLSGCPREAFQAFWFFANIGHLILNNSYLGHWFGDLRKDERIY